MSDESRDRDEPKTGPSWLDTVRDRLLGWIDALLEPKPVAVPVPVPVRRR